MKEFCLQHSHVLLLGVDTAQPGLTLRMACRITILLCISPFNLCAWIYSSKNGRLVHAICTLQSTVSLLRMGKILKKSCDCSFLTWGLYSVSFFSEH